MKDYKNICIICGKEFVPKRKDSRICSKECLKLFKPKKNLLPKELQCVICGTKFKPKTAIQKTCCRECGDKFRLYNYTIKERKPKQEYVSRKQLYKKQCVICNKEFETYSKRQIYCCKPCQLLAYKKPKKIHCGVCLWCGKEFESEKRTKYCSKECSNQTFNYNKLHHRPYKINNSKVNRVYRNKIGERDKWVCNICGCFIDKTLEYPDPMSPSLDHVIPLSKGGLHNEDNIHISHLRCNCVIKRDKV